MGSRRRSFSEPLARVNVPMYALSMITNRHLIVAGGGGSPNSGVKNGFEIHEISHDGQKFTSEQVLRHLTGPNAVMNCAAYNDGKRIYFVAGQENHCQLYNVKMKVVDSSADTPEINLDNQNRTHENESSNGGIRNRKKGEKRSEKATTNTSNNVASETNKKITFDVTPSDSIQTDFNKEEPVQKVVRIISTKSDKLMVTGGNDGHVRVWNFPDLTKRLDIAAHSKEVDDLDISPNAKYIVSLSRDNRALLWSLKTGEKVHSFTWTVPEGSKYLYKRCRFGLIEGDVNKLRLFTLTNPIGKVGKLTSHLQMWDPESGSLKKIKEYTESLSALAVSDDGRFVAVGTMFSGSVSLVIAFSLQQVLYVKGAHSMFVTGLLFLPTASEGPAITTRSETAVLSISVDNKVCIHSLDYRHSVPVWFAVVIIIVILFFVFVLCSYIGI